jgi:hypothetical protein
MSQVEDRTKELENKVGELEHSNINKGNNKKLQTEHARLLGHH